MGMYILLFIGTTPIGSYLIGIACREGGHASPRSLRSAGLCVIGVAAGAVSALRHRRDAARLSESDENDGTPDWRVEPRGTLDSTGGTA